MLIIEPMRHVEQRATRMRGTARGGQRRPRGVAQRHVQRRGLAHLLPGRDIGERALGHVRQIGTQRGAMEAATMAYFFTAWRCTGRPAWIGSSAWVACASASVIRCRRAAANPSTAPAPPPTRFHPEWRAHPVRHAPRAWRACSVSVPARRSRKIRSSRTRAMAVRSAMVKPKPSCIGRRSDTASITTSACCAGGRARDPLLGDNGANAASCARCRTARHC